MRNRSKITPQAEIEKLEHIEVDPAFPVSEASYNFRDEHTAVEPHLHDLLELGFCFEGSGVFLIGDKVLPFQTGDAVVINTREVHLARGNPGGRTKWGWIYLDPLRLLADIPESCGGSVRLSRCCGAAFRNLLGGSSHPEITGCIRRILAECTAKSPDYRPMVRSLVWQLMLLLGRYHSGAGADTDPDAPGDYAEVERLVPALNAIAANFQHEIPVSRLARLCFMSDSNFRKCFQRAMGCAPKPYLRKIRLDAAAALLGNSELPVLEIAGCCGFHNISNFNRQFRAAHGCPPREFRDQLSSKDRSGQRQLGATGAHCPPE